MENTAKPGITKVQEKISLQENLFGDTDPPMNFYGSNPPENDKDSEDMETETETEVNMKGTKQKDSQLLVNHSSEEDGDEEPQQGGDIINDLLQQNLETQQLNRELEMKLKAQELRFNLLVQATCSPRVPQQSSSSSRARR